MPTLTGACVMTGTCRFSPCVFIYLLAVVPPIWLLHLDYLNCASSNADQFVDQLADHAGHCTRLTRSNSTVCVSRRF